MEEQPQDFSKDRKEISNSEIFRELASELRYSILIKLHKRTYKQNEIAKELDMTLQESHRQFERLINAGLVRKNIDGFYH